MIPAGSGGQRGFYRQSQSLAKAYPFDYIPAMFTLKPLPGFTTWLETLPDVKVRSIISARLQRLARGLPGDVKPVGAGVGRTIAPIPLTGDATMIDVETLPTFDIAPLLVDSEEAIAAYLADILDANDDGLLASALGDIARARGMSEIARSAGLTREALYKALRPGSKPRFETIRRVCQALGVRLSPEPATTAGATS